MKFADVELNKDYYEAEGRNWHNLNTGRRVRVLEIERYGKHFRWQGGYQPVKGGMYVKVGTKNQYGNWITDYAYLPHIRGEWTSVKAVQDELVAERNARYRAAALVDNERAQRAERVLLTLHTAVRPVRVSGQTMYALTVEELEELT